MHWTRIASTPLDAREVPGTVLRARRPSVTTCHLRHPAPQTATFTAPLPSPLPEVKPASPTPPSSSTVRIAAFPVYESGPGLLPKGLPSHPTGSATVSAQELQTAVLLILALLGSIALLNLGTEINALAETWRSFADFLLNGFTVR